MRRSLRACGRSKRDRPGRHSPTGERVHLAITGPARAGLSFHSHAESWLGLVGGEKLWLIAEPGALPAAEQATGLTKLAWEWLVGGGLQRVKPGAVQVSAAAEN